MRRTAVSEASNSTSCARSYSACACAGTVADGGQPGPPEIVERAQHVHHDARLALVVEAQAGAGDRGQRAAASERPQGRRLDVVGGDVGLRGPRRRGERPRGHVIGPAGQQRERCERVCRAALAQVELDGVGIPAATVAAHGDEVDRRAADHARGGQAPSDLLGQLGDLPRVGGLGREAAAEVALAAGATEQLVVGRDDLDLSGRADLQLRARAADLGADDPLLDDPAVRGEAAEVAIETDALGLERHAGDPVGDGGALGADAGHREAAEVDDRVALARDALVELHDQLLDLRLAGPKAGDRVDRRRHAVDVLDAQRVGDAGGGEELATPALGPQMGVARIGSVHRDAELERDVALEGRRRVGHEVTAPRIGDRATDLAQQQRTLEQLLAQRAARRVVCGQQGQASACIAPAGRCQERQVVVDDLRRDGRRGDVGHVEVGLAEAEQQAQQPLLVGLCLGRRLVPLVDRARRHDDDRPKLAGVDPAGGLGAEHGCLREEKVCTALEIHGPAKSWRRGATRR